MSTISCPKGFGLTTVNQTMNNFGYNNFKMIKKITWLVCQTKSILNIKVLNVLVNAKFTVKDVTYLRLGLVREKNITIFCTVSSYLLIQYVYLLL